MNATPLPATDGEVLERYRRLQSGELEIVRQCKKQWSMVGYVRGLLFIASVVLLIAGFAHWAGIDKSVWFVFSGLAFFSFLVVAFLHERMQSRMRDSAMKAGIFGESIAQVGRDWESIKDRTPDIPESFRATAFDLDLVGRNSLHKLIGTTRTPLGDETLASWIVEGALPEEVSARQKAIAELKPSIEYREQFRFRCEVLTDGKSGPAGFLHWTDGESWLESRTWLVLLARITALISLASIVLLFTGLVPPFYPAMAVAAMVIVNFFVAIFFAGTMHDIFNLISSRRNEVEYYVRLFDMISDFEAKSGRLQDIQNRLLKDSGDARQQIHGLGRLVWLANIRRNGVIFVIYLAFEFLFLWDVHILDRLEAWKKKYGHYARGWFEDLGQWETLCALAKLAADNPEWVFPDVKLPDDPSGNLISCTQIGHPLLDQSRVCNDVDVGPTGTVLLVTGSNMSGKSTLLRSIGVNSVLGRMGSVVCAGRMTMPPVHIETSMRIIDSLSDGVSFFMAELKRLKEIVDTAGECRKDKKRCLLFLLDEILQGTNSRERQIAVSRVVRRLIDQEAIGAISTHDLDLATTDDLEQACRIVHFSEQFHEVDGKRQMTFDYRMKHGIAETTNALALLEMVGLGDESCTGSQNSGTGSQNTGS
ncbi:MAG: hypothetical protein AAF456_06310 [Planctomycetota bacterium]